MMARCDKCHEILKFVRLTSERDPYCHRCGHILGHCLQPSSWVCDECGDIVLDDGGDTRPGCDECGSPMTALSARPSRVHGAGTGDTALELGLASLMGAQEADLELGNDILRDSQT